jgi:uncharacterized phage infection (PIP) family protein YhgE
MANDIRFDINGVYKINTDEARASLGKLTKEAESLFMKKDVPLTKHVKELTQTLQQEDGTVKKVTRTFVQYRNELGRIVDAQGKLQRNAKGQFTNEDNWRLASEKTTKTVKKETEQVKQLDNQIKNLNVTQKEGVHSSNNLDLSFRSLGETLVKVAKFKIVTEILMAFINAGNEAIQIVKDFDKELTEFRKVSDLSGQDLENYIQKLGELGDAVASTTTEMVTASTEFVKAGFGEEQSAKLAQIAELYRNIADAELTAGESATFIISQMKAFGDETTTFAEHTINAVNNVSNHMAVSSSDITTALTKTSSAMAVLGNDYNQTIALVTAGAEQMQGQSSKVARGLRTIGNNIANLAQKQEEFTVQTQHGTESIELFNKETGEMKSTYDIISQLSSAWQDMSLSQKQALGISLAGGQIGLAPNRLNCWEDGVVTVSE